MRVSSLLQITATALSGLADHNGSMLAVMTTMTIMEVCCSDYSFSTASCQVSMGNPALPKGKYRIGKKQTETAEGLPSAPFYYVYKAINDDPSKGFWTEMTHIPEMRCTKE
jgi:hypothetical protein